MGNISFRLDDEIISQLEQRVEDDPKFGNRSELLRYAARTVVEGEYEQSG